MENILFYFIHVEMDLSFTTKRFYSVSLLFLVDYNYTFTYIDVSQGRISDSEVYNNSALKEAILNNSLNLPLPKSLSNICPNDIF